MDILENLNEEQKKAVTYGTGPLLIIAGAGTGKTTVITRRLAYLILNDLTKPEQILALTFSDKAAGEMEERVVSLLETGYFDLWISTFHAFGERILKDHALDIGLANNFRLLTAPEQWLLVKEHLEEFELDYYRPKGNPTRFIQALVNHFSRLKDENISGQEYVAYADSLELNRDFEVGKIKKRGISEEEAVKIDEAKRIREVAMAYQHYEQLLRENNAMDFGDLISVTLKLFSERPQILAKYREQFQFILVDEFQDTNFAQYQLVKLLAAPKNNLTVVGDDDQSIYAWRGASMSSILTFKQDFPNAREVSLTKNYRSAQNILDLAYSFIQHNNPNRLETTLGINKRLKSKNNSGKGEIKHLFASTFDGEGQLVVEQIQLLKQQYSELSYNAFAVLARANDQAQAFLPFFDRSGIPYQFLASRGLFSKPVILDILAWLNLLDNYHESRAMYRVLCYKHWQIPPEDIMRITQNSFQTTRSFYEVCEKIRMVKLLRPASCTTIEFILYLLQQQALETRYKTAGEIILQFLEKSGYLKALTREENRESTENILYLNEFFKYVSAFEAASIQKNSGQFLEQIRQMVESGEAGRLQPDFTEGPEAVKIMTVHAGKGLEFEYVFVVNMVDKRFPTVERKEAINIPEPIVKDILAKGDAHLEEERRLFYVAMTRAKKGLFFTSAEDYGGVRKKRPSRFLVEAGYANTPIKPTGAVFFTKKLAESIVKKPTYNPPREFSFTQLKGYETCPWQYRFAFVLRVPAPGKASFSFGRTIHRTLYEFVRRVKEKSELSQESLFGAKNFQNDHNIVVPSLEELLKIYADFWIDEWYTSKRNREEYYKKGEEALTEFYGKFIILRPKVLFLEQGFHVNIGKYRLKGVIDRVDEVNGKIEIIDYKTGMSPKSGQRDLEQLYIYALAVKEMLKHVPETLIYYFIEENKPLSCEYLPKKMVQTEQWVINLIEKILQGNFSATPGHHCRFCDYREICEFRKE